MNNDYLSDEELITMYARLLLNSNQLPDEARTSFINLGLNLSTTRFNRIMAQIRPFVRDRLSNEELSEAALEYCRKNNLKVISKSDWISIVEALGISPERFREFGRYIRTNPRGWSGTTAE